MFYDDDEESENTDWDERWGRWRGRDDCPECGSDESEIRKVPGGHMRVCDLCGYGW